MSTKFNFFEQVALPGLTVSHTVYQQKTYLPGTASAKCLSLIQKHQRIFSIHIDFHFFMQIIYSLNDFQLVLVVPKIMQYEILKVQHLVWTANKTKNIRSNKAKAYFPIHIFFHFFMQFTTPSALCMKGLGPE